MAAVTEVYISRMADWRPLSGYDYDRWNVSIADDQMEAKDRGDKNMRHGMEDVATIYEY